MQKVVGVMVVAFGCLVFGIGAALAQSAGFRGETSPSHQVPLYKSVVIPLRQSAKRVSVGNPGVADILVIRSDELYIVGKALGSTNVTVWDYSGRVFAAFDIEVTHDLPTLKSRLHELMPGENVKVYSAQEQLILAGEVSSAAQMDVARQVATGFLPDCIRAESDAPGTKSRSADPSCKQGSVVNMMQVGGANQVMLKVTVAEMSRTVVKRLESNLNLLRFGANGGKFSGGAVNGGASFPNALDENSLAAPLFGSVNGAASPIGPLADLFEPNLPSIDGAGLFLSYLQGDTFVQAVLDISKRNGLAKILSEPTLTTLTGQEAEFLSGGEFPIPVPQGGTGGSVTIEFKEFGVGVKFLPVVLDSGRINLKLNVSVSEVSGDNNVVLRSADSSSSFLIPSLTKRSASSTVELGDGQTIGIAGLINDNVREFVEKFPGLGDLPIIGALFRSQEFQSGKSELVIFVTPYLARPILPHQVRLPTDTFVAPGDLSFYLLGQMEWTKDRKEAVSGSEAPKGHFGHQLRVSP